MRITVKETVTGVKAIRLTDELGTDGTRWRSESQATNFNELDVFGSPTLGDRDRDDDAMSRS